jgi:hypothetical protein
LDETAVGIITKDSFMRVVSAMKRAEAIKQVHPHYLENRWPALYNSASYKLLTKVVKNHWFEAGINIINVLNMLELLIEELLDRKNTSHVQLYDDYRLYLQITFVIVFFAEMSMKIFVSGLLVYLESPINKLDFGVNIVSVILLGLLF